MTPAQRLAAKAGTRKRILVMRAPLLAGEPCWRIVTSRGAFTVAQWYADGPLAGRHVRPNPGGKWVAYLATTAALRWA